MNYQVLAAELQHALPAPTRRRVPLCRSGQWCWLTVRSVDDDV